MRFQNIYSLFREQTAKYRGQPVFYTRDGNDWRAQNWEDFEEQVHDVACALLARGLTKSASVAILAGNIPEWTIMDIATIAAGGVGTGIYPTSSAEQAAFIINHSDAKFVFVDTAEQLEKILCSENAFPKLKAIICLEAVSDRQNEKGDERPLLNDVEIIFYSELLEFGRTKRAEFLPKVEKIGFGANPEDTAIMVYTSGTTGEPKGAMLSHRYILNSAQSLRRSVPIFDTDVSFSYLPGCHVAERISGIYNRLYNGASVYFVDDLTKLYSYMLEVKPTVFASLPRFFEKIHATIAAKYGTEKVDAQIVKDHFGGRIRLLTSGGAPLPLEIAQFFADAGVPILQAYGLTENICVAFNRADDLKFGTVGKPMPMCEVKIAGDGEILVKSEMMFSGYYKEAEKTAEMFDENDWLKTGDLGSMDEDGFLKITGRKKEIIVLSSGKNVAPALLENYLKENHLISQAFIYGDGKNFISALITLNKDETESFARAGNIQFESFTDLIQDPEILRLVERQVEKTNSRVSTSEQIKKYFVLERDFSSQFDELTPTLKLKRNMITEKFKELLEKFYE